MTYKEFWMTIEKACKNIEQTLGQAYAMELK
jgi:hypothetical protein